MIPFHPPAHNKGLIDEKKLFKKRAELTLTRLNPIKIDGPNLIVIWVKDLPIKPQSSRIG